MIDEALSEVPRSPRPGPPKPRQIPLTSPDLSSRLDNMTTHKLIAVDDAGHQRSTRVPPDTPLGLVVALAQADATSHDDSLQALRDITALRHWLDEQTDDNALRARRSGATWQQIGSALGLTRQAVHLRWGNLTTFAGPGETRDGFGPI